MNVNDAIFRCRVCNETPYTNFRCDCDMGIKKPKKVPQVLVSTPHEENSLRALVVPGNELPGDLIEKYKAIDKIFQEKSNGKR